MVSLSALFRRHTRSNIKFICGNLRHLRINNKAAVSLVKIW